MKRIVLVIATFVFVLTGCASVETNEKTASIPTGTTISIDNPQVSAIYIVIVFRNCHNLILLVLFHQVY